MIKEMIHWSIEDGLKLIRALQPGAHERKFHLALGGGVLNKGKSYNDLDIICLHMSAEQKGNRENLVGYIEGSIRVKFKNISEEYNKGLNYEPDRTIYSGIFKNKKIDLIFYN